MLCLILVLKFAAYRSLASLREYVLVDIPSHRVESFRRTPCQDWLFHVSVGADGDCLFPSLDASIPFDEIFEDVDFDAAASGNSFSDDGQRNQSAFAVGILLTESSGYRSGGGGVTFRVKLNARVVDG